MPRYGLTLGVVALLATGLQACVRERTFHHHPHAKRQATARTPLSQDESVLVDSFDSNSIEDWAFYYMSGAHLGGQNRSQAQWTADRWSEAGFESRLDEYNVYLNYPVNKSMVMTYANGSVFEPQLEEDVLEEDPYTQYPNAVPTFHGYSASGMAEAEFVYVGRGQVVDFERLVELGVPLEGKIAIAQYGAAFRGLKVQNAADYGMIACIIFTDPAQDGNVTVANGYEAYPNGPARNPSAVERGSVMFLSTYPGDPTTPGYVSRKDSPRADTSNVLPQIPSIPISYRDALPILQALDGHGTSGEEVNRTGWVGALDATYSTGPAPGVTISMSNYMRDSYEDIWNTIGVLNGTNADETLVIGNHRDAWIIGGADPNSGSAVLIELARAIGALVQSGWTPKRNIVLASWDAEEYGLVGSTEWVEEYIPWLTETAVTYLNIDVGTSGPHPDISATPELHALGAETMKKVLWPALGGNQTMYDVWYEDTEGEIGVLGSGSDYTAFLHRGIASLDMGSSPGPLDPIYPYHNNYDNFHWMSNFGDPGFVVHRAMGQYLSLLTYHLASDEYLPLDPVNYANEMTTYYESLRETVDAGSEDLDTSAIQTAIDGFRQHAEEAVQLRSRAEELGDTQLVQVVNGKYRDFQRGFTSQGGLPDREFYRHVVFAPGLDTGYAPVLYPGVTEALEAGNYTLAAEWVEKTARAIEVAGDILKT